MVYKCNTFTDMRDPKRNLPESLKMLDEEKMEYPLNYLKKKSLTFFKIVNGAKTHFIKGHRCTIYILLIRSIIWLTKVDEKRGP